MPCGLLEDDPVNFAGTTVDGLGTDPYISPPRHIPTPAPRPLRRIRPISSRAMRELFPEPADDVDAVDRYLDEHRVPPDDRPWVMLNMITSIDGATTAAERSGGLGGPADRAVFMMLRALCDAILVGAGTMHTENYGPPQLSAEARAARVARGQSELPKLVSVSRGLSIGPDEKAFSDPARRATVITTTSSDDARRASLSSVADIITAGDDAVDLAEALRQLRSSGVELVLCEGGPTLNGALAAADLIDEICWTVSPTVLGGASRRMVAGPPAEVDTAMRPSMILEQDGFVFMRYVRR